MSVFGQRSKMQPAKWVNLTTQVLSRKEIYYRGYNEFNSAKNNSKQTLFFESIRACGWRHDAGLQLVGCFCCRTGQ